MPARSGAALQGSQSGFVRPRHHGHDGDREDTCSCLARSFRLRRTNNRMPSRQHFIRTSCATSLHRKSVLCVRKTKYDIPMSVSTDSGPGGLSGHSDEGDLTDELSFAPEAEQGPSLPASARSLPPPWKILIVDDEPEIHAITQLALGGLVLDGRAILVQSAHSAQEAREILAADNDVALVLLDVVMEREHAGLDLARWIRRELCDQAIRIVLRTGQPGLAPEQRVMLDYDINDYRAKTELTAQRLVTTILGGIRSYRDISIIDQQKVGLSRVISATASLFERSSLLEFLTGILTQLAGLFGPKKNALFVKVKGPLFGRLDEDPTILAGNGRFQMLIGSPIGACLEPDLVADLEQAVCQPEPLHRPQYSIYGLCQEGRSCAAVYIETGGRTTSWENSLVEIFCRNAAVALENLMLHERQLALLRAIERFVPTRLLELIGSVDVTCTQVGDHASREMTVVFADLRGFTTLAERLTPQETFTFLNDFFGQLVPVIHSHGGVVDKYLGDGIMALFPGSPEEAVLAGIAMIEKTRSFAESHPALPASPRLGVGVHIGQMTLGLLGAADRIEFTAVSDSVNITSRVERLTRTYDADLLITRDVLDRLPESLRANCRILGQVEIRGKHRQVEIFEVFSTDPEPLRRRKMASQAPLMEVVGLMKTAAWENARAKLAELALVLPGDRALSVLDHHCWRMIRLAPDEQEAS